MVGLKAADAVVITAAVHKDPLANIRNRSSTSQEPPSCEGCELNAPGIYLTAVAERTGQKALQPCTFLSASKLMWHLGHIRLGLGWPEAGVVLRWTL